MATKLLYKSIAVSMAAAMLTVTTIPVSSADAGNRKHHRKHYRKHDNTGDIIGAGIIGLALGAIIIGASEHRRRRADHIYRELPAYTPPQHINGYQSDYYYEEPEVIVDRRYRDEYDYSQPVVRPEYRRENDSYKNPRQRNSHKSEPKVITYNDAVNNTNLAEPWTPEWHSYCRSKFRSFNATTGTFLGYDGKRHFCVPK